MGVNINIEVSEELHQRVKIQVAKENKTMKDFLIELMEKNTERLRK